MVGLSLGGSISAGQAAIVISNLPHGFFANTSSISTQAQKAVSFTMAPGQDYRLTDVSLVTVGLDATTLLGGDLPDLFIATNNGGIPGISLGSLINPTSPTTLISLHQWLAPADYILTAGETYWLVVTESRGSWNWLRDDQNDAPTTTEIGASYGQYIISADTGATWNPSGTLNPVQINAVPHNVAGVPEPTTGVVSLLLLCGLIMNRRKLG